NQAYIERLHLRADALAEACIAAGWTPRPRATDAGHAREYAHPGYLGRIGIIAPYSKYFCAGCNRLRVTARGDLRLCRFGDFGIGLRPLLQADDDFDALVARISPQLGLKAAGHGPHHGEAGLTPHLASIGG